MSVDLDRLLQGVIVFDSSASAATLCYREHFDADTCICPHLNVHVKTPHKLQDSCMLAYFLLLFYAASEHLLLYANIAVTFTIVPQKLVWTSPNTIYAAVYGHTNFLRTIVNLTAMLAHKATSVHSQSTCLAGRAAS